MDKIDKKQSLNTQKDINNASLISDIEEEEQQDKRIRNTSTSSLNNKDIEYNNQAEYFIQQKVSFYLFIYIYNTTLYFLILKFDYLLL